MIARRRLLGGLAALAVAAPGMLPAPGRAQEASLLESEARATLDRLRASEPVTERMIRDAAGLMVFPEIVKGGFIVGAAGGKGVLFAGGRVEGYYRSTAVSYGLQAGLARFGYVMFLMDAAALDFVRSTQGWEVGVGPNVTVADEGFARRLSTSTVQEGIYVFFVGQEGFFAGAGIEGTKITRIAE